MKKKKIKLPIIVRQEANADLIIIKRNEFLEKALKEQYINIR